MAGSWINSNAEHNVGEKLLIGWCWFAMFVTNECGFSLPGTKPSKFSDLRIYVSVFSIFYGILFWR